MGVLVLRHGSDTVEQQRERASVQNGNEKKFRMNGRWRPGGRVVFEDGGTTFETRKKETRNLLLEVGGNT